MSRQDHVRTRIEQMRRRSVARGAPITLKSEDVTFLLDELKSQRANISALQKRLNSCRNLHDQKDAMIKRRDNSLIKAHRYIEQLKNDTQELRAQVEIVANELKKRDIQGDMHEGEQADTAC